VFERARLRDAGFFRENFSGRIVLIGDVTQDLVNTPFTSRKPHHRTPGVEVQANIINTMLRNAPLRIVPESTAFILLLLLASLAAGVSFRLRPVGGFLLSLTIFAAFIYAAFQLFAHERLLLPCASAALAVLMVYSSTSCAKYFLEEREKRRTREIFSRYAPREAVERILDDYGSLRLKGDRLEITVLFADINGFTPLAERQSSEETIAMLNEYFERISGTIAKNQGLIMQYVGDEVMIIFGAPVARAAHAEMGLLTALGMMKDVALLKKEREERGLPGFDIKIGINSGEVVLGTLGSSRRMEYAAVGDVINTASRVMGLNKNSDLGISSGILLTERTRELAGPSFKYLSLGNHHLKGKEEEVAVYELVESDASSV
jgi:adenylate cyclase